MVQNSVLMLFSQQQMLDRIVTMFENARTEVLAFLNAYTLTITTDDERYQVPKKEARKRGIKLRYITEITKENLSYCKRQLDMVDELRHLNKINGNFLMSDSEFLASHEISAEHPISEGFYSNVNKIVKLQGFVFETMWENAMPAADRIKQLEASSSRLLHADEKKKQITVFDRFYVCPQCNFITIYSEEAQGHGMMTRHDRAKEFPFFHS
jgi:hypothetical protein